MSAGATISRACAVPTEKSQDNSEPVQHIQVAVQVQDLLPAAKTEETDNDPEHPERPALNTEPENSTTARPSSSSSFNNFKAA